MRYGPERILLAAILGAAFSGPGCRSDDVLRDTPVNWSADLPTIATQHHAETLTHLLPEGLIVYLKFAPGDVKALYEHATVQADGAFHNGLWLASLCFRYAVEKDSALLPLIKKTWDAHHLLITGSGYPGLVARTYGKKDPSDPALMFRTDGSGDGMCGWVFGASAFWNLIDDPERKAQIASDLKAICAHLRKHDLKIYQDENTPTPYGDFKSPVMGVPIGHYGVAMMALANLAVRANPSDAVCDNFLAWLVEKDYHRQAQYYYPWFPHSAANTNMYGMNLFTVWWNDPTPHRREFYKKGADAWWESSHAWQMAFYGLVYRFVGGTDHGGSIQDSIDRLRNMRTAYERTVNESEFVKDHLKIVPIESRPLTSTYWADSAFTECTKFEGPTDGSPYARVDFLLAYWLGRYLGEYVKRE
jgi:hypothetical protein